MRGQGSHRAWTQEEEDLLREHWGKWSYDRLAKELGRTKTAIQLRAGRLGLPPWLESGDYVTLNTLLLVMTGRNDYHFMLKSWVEKRGMPVHTVKRSSRCRVRVVYLEEFWKWAEKNRHFLDFSRLEENALGKEPPWLPEQRKKDSRSARQHRRDCWTQMEEERMIHLLRQHKYGYSEIAKMLGRTEGAVVRRCRTLGLKERPVRRPTHDGEWTQELLDIIADGIRSGDSYPVIAERIGKSEKAVRGKVQYTYLTERPDKVRAMLAGGPWGSNRPVPTVLQALAHSEHRRRTKKQLAALAGLLEYRKEQIEEETK